MTPLVLLPGMMCDARLFEAQTAAFSSTRAVHIGPMREDSVTASAAHILRDAPPLFALAGLSMGGIVAMEVLRLAPDRVDRIALLDTNHRAETVEIRARREPQIEKVQMGKLEGVMRDEMKPNYLTDGPHRARILDLCLEMAKTLGPEVFVAQSRALQNRPDQTVTLQSCAVPALILCGRDDMLCPVHRHESMHSLIARSTLEIIEKAGHLPTLEQPEQTTAALARWLEAT
jgi:pimeloyl-ACP methyl ester carboxylesterase